MTKVDLIKEVSRAVEVPYREAEAMVDTIFAGMVRHFADADSGQ